MTIQNVKELLFPYGYWYLYPLFLIWIIATSIFYITLPAMLSATAYRMEIYYGTINYANPLVSMSATLYGVAFNLMQLFLLFLIASAVFDAIEAHKRKQLEKGYL